MKSEVLHQRYRGRIRPLAHYTLGRLPRWLRLIGLAPGLVNAVGRARGFSRLAMHAMGADPRRSLPRIPEQTFHSWWKRRAATRRDGPEVALWADCFSNAVSPHAARAAVTVLEEAGCRVRVVSPDVCCGLTLITTGQLDAAKRELTRMLDAIADLLAAGTPIVALEPSCLAVLRKDAHELLPDDTRAAQARRGSSRSPSSSPIVEARMPRRGVPPTCLAWRSSCNLIVTITPSWDSSQIVLCSRTPERG